jgi:hypothetical protein
MIVKKKCWPILKIFSFRVVLGLCGIIVAPPIMVKSKNVSLKSYYLCITNKEITHIPKSKSKKFSILCTFNRLARDVCQTDIHKKTKTLSHIDLCSWTPPPHPAPYPAPAPDPSPDTSPYRHPPTHPPGMTGHRI